MGTAVKSRYPPRKPRAIAPVPTRNVDITIPESMIWVLQEKARYKIGWGGRNAAKSWNSKTVILLRSMQERINVLCTRQVLNSIKQSVHKLLIELIEYYKLGDFFKITDNKITCTITGSVIDFKGLASFVNDPTSLKMLDFYDVVDIEEGESLLEATWNSFFPSVRKEGSEIWIWFNTDSRLTLDSFVYKRFVLNPPTVEKSIVKRLYYWDNPHLSKTSLAAIESCKQDTPDLYRQIYLGDPEGATELLYPEFNIDVHRRKFDCDYLWKHGNFFCSIDPHKVYYPFLLWGVKVPIGNNEYNYIVYNEFPSVTNSIANGRMYHEFRKSLSFPYTLNQLSDIIRILNCSVGDFQRPIRNITRAADPFYVEGSGGRDWSSATKGFVQESCLPENGGLVWNVPDRKFVSDGRMSIRNNLYYHNGQPIGATNDAHLFIMPHCINLLNSLRFHRYDFERACEDEKRKDPSDALRILMAVMTRSVYRQPDSENREQEQPKSLKAIYSGLFFSTTKGMR